MSNKSNNATFNRPQGSRPIDAPVLVTHIEESVQLLESEEAWQKNNRNAVTLFKTEGFSTVLVALHKGADITDNVTEGILSIQVLSGSVEVQLEDKKVIAGKGELVFMHRLQQHVIKALEDCRLLAALTGEKNIY
ncbi:hypothetical protein SAMN05421788_11113 [Filimonas lacunae]|uniref:Cupin domain-containing protein n=1 Tax=Filimonas lacunae TaxID=477680 RepID=A0A173MBD6_9BACT|nr:hypothetical protein [Filimonas lacunae]BAV04788.1 hypothetical protein FLA_0787 [Filimonas lacunae]SIT32065.1 hypothetical protein SAMN05421788_11113 [Filimonas lacunae]